MEDANNYCVECYQNTDIPNGKDFHKVGGELVGEWSPMETRKLLAAVKESPVDWGGIASQMINKSAQQCVMHFLSLPIEEQYIDKLLKRNSHESFNTSGKSSGSFLEVIKLS